MIRPVNPTPTTKGKYQIMPDLTPEAFADLKASIAERGVDIPIIVDDEGNIIDGWHRQRACDELGIFFIRRRAQVMRLRREPLHPGFEIAAREGGVEALLALDLFRGRRVAISCQVQRGGRLPT